MAETIDLAIGNVQTTALTALPVDGDSVPGVVITFHRGGLDAFTAWLADDLAANGYAAIAPNHYHALPDGVGLDDRRDHLTDEQMAFDIETSADWLAAQDRVDGDRLALIGHCMGGRTTLVGLAAFPGRWRCGGDWYGGRIFSTMGNMPSPADRIGDIACPVAGFFGNDDADPSPDDVDRLDALLTGHGIEHEFHRYDDAGHAFMNFGSGSYREAAARDSWAKALGFLERHLK